MKICISLLSFFYFGIYSCSQMIKVLEPKQSVRFYVKVEEDDMYVNLTAGLISVGENVFYKIHTPEGLKNKRKKVFETSDSMQSVYMDESVAEDDVSSVLPRNLTKKFDSMGLYMIEIFSKEDEQVKFSIGTHAVKKIYKGNEDIAALRNILASLQTAIGALGNENFYAKDIQANNIKEVKRINKIINFMFIYPILIVLFGFGKDYFARQLVRPVGKRFHGLF